MMYTEIGEVSEATVEALKAAMPHLKWQDCVSDVTCHRMAGSVEHAMEVPELVERWPVENWVQASWLTIEPGGNLFRHYDEGFAIAIPLELNSKVRVSSFATRVEPHGERFDYSLEVGKAYDVDRRLPHESVNDGDTNRTVFMLMLKGRYE
jgi:hypothetical protein